LRDRVKFIPMIIVSGGSRTFHAYAMRFRLIGLHGLASHFEFGSVASVKLFGIPDASSRLPYKFHRRATRASLFIVSLFRYLAPARLDTTRCSSIIYKHIEARTGWEKFHADRHARAVIRAQHFIRKPCRNPPWIQDGEFSRYGPPLCVLTRFRAFHDRSFWAFFNRRCGLLRPSKDDVGLPRHRDHEA